MALIFCFLLALIGQAVNADLAQQQALSAATSDFSQRLYQKVALNKNNVVYSGYSIHSALSMTSLGARGLTATEMATTLGVTSVPGTVHQAYHDLIVQMNSVENVTVNTANGIFVNPNMPIESNFISGVEQNYLATTENLDFSDPAGPEQLVNDFVDNKTHHLIQNILPSGSIDGSTVMILVNTIFFNGTWMESFAEYKTHKQDFNQLGGTKTQVDMMNDVRYVNIKRDNTNRVDIAELPFVGDRFSLYIALPQQTDGITQLEQLLATPGKVDDFFTGLSSTNVQLSIPKFKIETKLGLNNVLMDMGMVKAFVPAEADFSGISTAGQVYISDVIHQATIDVKETGTVAAAATVVGFVFASFVQPPNEVFSADHPFIFFLRDKQNGQILFQGKFSG